MVGGCVQGSHSVVVQSEFFLGGRFEVIFFLFCLFSLNLKQNLTGHVSKKRFDKL